MGVNADDVYAYRREHFPERVARDYIPGRPVPIPGDDYVAELSHARFHEWFGTRCDDTCPHLRYERAPDAAPLPVARVVRR